MNINHFDISTGHWYNAVIGNHHEIINLIKVYVMVASHLYRKYNYGEIR